MFRRLASAAAVAAILPAIAASCGDPGGNPILPPTRPEPPTGPGTRVELPSDPDAVFLEVWEHAGFVPVEHSVGRPPLIWLQVSGQIVVLGPAPEIYPGYILPPLFTGRLGSAALAEVIAAIEATDLPGGGEDINIDDLIDRVADAPTFEFKLNEADRGRSIFVYAMGFRELESDPRVVALTGLLDVVSRLGEVATEEYYGGRMQVVNLGVQPFPEPDLVNFRPWPLPVPPNRPDGFGCHEFEGAQADAVLEAFFGANHAARWLYDGRGYQLVARPLLPEEPGCVGY